MTIELWGWYGNLPTYYSCSCCFSNCTCSLTHWQSLVPVFFVHLSPSSFFIANIYLFICLFTRFVSRIYQLPLRPAVSLAWHVDEDKHWHGNLRTAMMSSFPIPFVNMEKINSSLKISFRIIFFLRFSNVEWEMCLICLVG